MNQNCLAGSRSELLVNKVRRNNKARLRITLPCPRSSLQSLGLLPVSLLGYEAKRKASRNEGIVSEEKYTQLEEEG